MGRTTQGVTGMRLSKDDEVLSMMIVKDVNCDLFVLTENGFGKRTTVSAYKKQKRGGLGVKTIKITKKKGKIAGAGLLKDEFDVMIIATNGILIRIPAKSISRIGRSTQGVKAINLSGDSKVASYAIVASQG
jgi:DNA gyrase subunit A